MERPTSLSSRPPQTGWCSLASFLGLALLVACSGGQGCSGCGGTGFAPIKGGFPVDKRRENALALRLSKGLFDFISATGPQLVRQFLPGGQIDIPSSCGGNTEICCGQMCKLQLDVTAIGFAPQPPSTMRVQLRSRLRTLTDMRVKIKQGILQFDCRVNFDSARRGRPDIGVVASLITRVNQQTRLTSMDVDPNSIDILDIDNDDIDIDGGFACEIVDFLKGFFIGTLKDQLRKQVAGPLENAFCQRCASRDECSSLANQGCNGKYCMRDGVCMQRLGVEGRMAVGGLLGTLAPSARGASMDLYAVAGGYADVESVGGMSLGLLGGAYGMPPSPCVPSRPAPAPFALPKPLALSGNQTPAGKPFHVGLGISTLELDTLGHAFYESGGLCLSVGTPQVALLSSGTLSTLVRSLEDLTGGRPASVYLVLRPQHPPTFALGKGTYRTDGMGRRTLVDPLMKIGLKDFALDFYLHMDERYVRFMRLVSDVSIPLGLDVDNMNRLVPILGDLGDALSNIRVSDTALLKESPQALAALFPRLLPLLLGQVAGTLRPIQVPPFMGLSLKPVQITAVDGRPGRLDFLALYFELAAGAMALGEDGQLWVAPPASQVEPVETTAELAALEVPDAAALSLGANPRAVLRVDGRGSGSLEWQYAVDDGLWRPFDDRHEVVIDDPVLGLPGRHHVDVRARVVGSPETLDPTPARVVFDVRPPLSWNGQAFHGRVEDAGGGCASCAAGGRTHPDGAGWAVLALALATLLAMRRHLRRAPGQMLVLLLLPLLVEGACANTQVDTPPVGAGDHFAATDEIGRYLSAVSHGNQIFLSAYNSTWGDLAFASVHGPGEEIRWQVVDGLPAEPPTNPAMGAPRRGHEEPGPDVGRFTSLAFTSSGSPVIAYQDVSAGAVKLAIGSAEGWRTSFVAEPPQPGAKLGLFTQLAVGPGDALTVAYMSTGVRREGGRIVSQLVVAQATTREPSSPADWTNRVVEEVEVPCGGFCAPGEACVAVGPKRDPQPSVCRPTGTGCTGCRTDQACVESRCQDTLAAPPAGIPEGTGLFLRLLQQHGQPLVVFHNRVRGAVKMAVGPEFAVQVLDGGDGKVDVGQHLGAALAEDGTLHLAYVDALLDRLLYRAIRQGKATPVELADDGIRGAGMDRAQHAVGAGAMVFLDGGVVRVAYQDQTLGTLEVATREPSGWSRRTLGPGGTRSRGYYPQVVRLGTQWIVLDLTYDRVRETPLMAVEMSPL